MSRTFEVTLGGEVYTLHRFNIGELQRMADFQATMTATQSGFAMFQMALERAEPAVPDPKLLEPTQQEFKDAMAKMLEAAGLTTGAA